MLSLAWVTFALSMMVYSARGLVKVLQYPTRRIGGGQAPNLIQLKEQLRSLTRGTKNGVEASATLRTEIAGLVTQLERTNKVKKLTSSPLIGGNWKLLFTTNDGSSAGKIGPFVGDVFQEVDLDKRSYNNLVNLGPLTGRLTATWDNLSDQLWKVKFQELDLILFGLKLKTSPLSAEGTWRMTYLDEDLRILFAKGGKNLEKENIYILSK